MASAIAVGQRPDSGSGGNYPRRLTAAKDFFNGYIGHNPDKSFDEENNNYNGVFLISHPIHERSDSIFYLERELYYIVLPTN